MVYQQFQFFANANNPVRFLADQANQFLMKFNELRDSPHLRQYIGYCEQVSLLGFTHVRPPFDIRPVAGLDGKLCEVIEDSVTATPFCNLVRFRKDTAATLPRVLLVAPMSGHFATLLRGTVQVLVQDHEVYLTDWLNVRDIPVSEGEFDLDAYVAEIIGFLRFMGPQSHLIGVCQPTVACLAAASVMAQGNDDCTPASLTLMAGPIDARSNPTKVNELAMSKPIDWFEQKLISRVPMQFRGAGRRVYPGFLQLTAFMSMNLDRHRESLRNLYRHRAAGENDKADSIRDFYKEYFAVMDMAAPYYLETVKNVFQDYLLANGRMQFQGRPVDPGALRKTFLLTVEGERDDICGIGQTLAAQDLCRRLPAYRKTHHLQAGVGHYGVFSGKKWAAQIYPVLRGVVQYAS